MNDYYVYELAFPDGTFKYGATRTPKEQLWNEAQQRFKYGSHGVQEKIEECGWENVKFTVLVGNQSKEDARKIQMRMSWRSKSKGSNYLVQNNRVGRMYSVYTFTFPDRTKFVGLTYQHIGVGVSSLWSDAWGFKGNGFNGNNDALYRKIQACGWEMIQKNVLAEKLSKEEAYALRREYREKYMREGLWFNARKKKPTAVEMLQEIQEVLTDRLDREIENAVDEVSKSTLEYVKDEVLVECLTDVWDRLEKK